MIIQPFGWTFVKPSGRLVVRAGAVPPGRGRHRARRGPPRLGRPHPPGDRVPAGGDRRRAVRRHQRRHRPAQVDLVADERRRTADALAEVGRGDEFLRLKVEGILDCGEVLVVALTDGRERYVFGRRTLPEMDVASAACAIQNLWLAARVEGLGVGWVSIFDPDAVAHLLGMPDGARPLAILCLGAVDRFYERPMLEDEGWDSRRPLSDLVWQDRWGCPPSTP